MRALVAGWFSFEQMGATAGDLISRDVVRGWLEQAGCAYDIAVAPPFSGGVDWRHVDPQAYSHVVFVCGPFGNGPPVDEFLDRFRGVRLLGVNLSMLHAFDEWNPFDLLLERDSTRRANPDLVFLGPPPAVPVVGLVLIHAQPEYGTRDLHERANDALRRLVARREAAVMRIDTRLDEANEGGLRTSGEIEAAISRMDLVLTTRLHGMVLALKNGVPAVVVDPVEGGAKIREQAASVGWETAFAAESVTDEALDAAFDECLSPAARERARACARQAANRLAALQEEFHSFLAATRGPGSR